MTEQQVLNGLGALSQETRLRVLRFLVQAGPEGRAAGDIGEAVDATASRLSFHLTTLENAGLIRSQRVSRNIIYRANFERVGKLIGYLLKNCCGDHPDIRACCDFDSECCASDSKSSQSAA